MESDTSNQPRKHTAPMSLSLMRSNVGFLCAQPRVLNVVSSVVLKQRTMITPSNSMSAGSACRATEWRIAQTPKGAPSVPKQWSGAGWRGWFIPAGEDEAMAHDPVVNARTAWWAYQRSGWGPWSCAR